jgi:site-specific DNA recombinase
MLRTVIYSRKSLEDDDRQVQSIESQEHELRPLAVKRNLSVFTEFGEAQSAKQPGRPKFNQMLSMVNRGEIDVILCWKLDRLARNPIDGAAVIWAMKTHGLIVMTPQQTFSQAEDNQILMYIEFGMAQKYIDDLGRNTKRGLNMKAEKGWCPGIARMGYLNSKIEERGQKTILTDPDRFSAVRRMWDLMLTGNYTPPQIQKIANEQWGFKTLRRKRSGGKPLSRSTIYKIFSDPFYHGLYEYPKGSGKWHQGKHKPMVTRGEFGAVRILLSKEAPSRLFENVEFSFNGLLRCGECGSAITAHSKIQVRCTRCRHKSSIKSRQACARCGLTLDQMSQPQIRRYAYYHCTRTLRPSCRQKCISSESAEQQVRRKVVGYRLPEALKNWGLAYIQSLRDQELQSRKQILREKEKLADQCAMRLLSGTYRCGTRTRIEPKLSKVLFKWFGKNWIPTIRFSNDLPLENRQFLSRSSDE